MKEALMQCIEEILAKAFKLGFHSADTGIKNAFFRFLEIALKEMIHQGTLDTVLTKSFDRLLQSDTLVSALVEKIGAQSLPLQFDPNKGMSNGKFEKRTSKYDHLVASLSQSSTKSSSKRSDAESIIYNKHEARKAGKTAKSRSRREGRKSKRYEESSSSSPASDAESDNTSSDSLEGSSTPESVHRRGRRTKKDLGDWLDVIHTVTTRFRRAVNYRMYQLANKWSKYNYTVSKNIIYMVKRMTGQMKPHTFDPFDPILIIGSLRNIKLACDTNGIHECAAIWLLHFFMKTSVSSALHSRLASNQKARTRVSSRAKTTTLSTYPQVVNSLLRTNATDENIADLEDAITTFSQPPGKTPAQYAEELI